MSDSNAATAPIWLPPTQRYRLAATAENGWSDQYGAVPLAATYAGVALPPDYRVHGVWQHGCHGPWMDLSPAIQSYSAPGAEKMPVFVAREDQVHFLLSHGYRRVRAIGLPIVYTSATPAPRQSRSLLVVPTHTLSGETFHDRTPFERYADEIKAAAAGFDRVTVCVHPSCQQNGLWIDEFTNRGLEIVVGAFNADCHALGRMRALFEQFENVTTNGWGSHIAYALAFGARVSIYGTRPERSEENLLKDQSWAVQPAMLKRVLSAETAARERSYLADFHVPPAWARADEERGRWLIGWDRRVSPAEMRSILGEIVQRLPSREEILARAREQRRQVRDQARQLARAGRRQDAALVLVRLAQAVVKLKDPGFIRETLEEVARELRPIDPAKANLLNEQVRRLPAAGGAAN